MKEDFDEPERRMRELVKHAELDLIEDEKEMLKLEKDIDAQDNLKIIIPSHIERGNEVHCPLSDNVCLAVSDEVVSQCQLYHPKIGCLFVQSILDKLELN